ncbi:Uncharacterised protein [Streptococcus suis]|uniref:Uncharacterized protein n=1 Tax=Streptococcus suis TaxID=1307 RepID=A0A123TDQ9_STRSU|nr:Uncharacterised protein [Streptococcus suis]
MCDSLTVFHFENMKWYYYLVLATIIINDTNRDWIVTICLWKVTYKFINNLTCFSWKTNLLNNFSLYFLSTAGWKDTSFASYLWLVAIRFRKNTDWQFMCDSLTVFHFENMKWYYYFVLAAIIINDTNRDWIVTICLWKVTYKFINNLTYFGWKTDLLNNFSLYFLSTAIWKDTSFASYLWLVAIRFRKNTDWQFMCDARALVNRENM